MSKGRSNAWKLRNIVDVTDPEWGAKGDGVTDDSLAIQAALDSLGDNGGGYAYAKGTFLASGLTVPNDQVGLIGANIRASRLRFTDTDGTLLTVTGALFHIENFEIESPGATHTAGAILDVQGTQGYVNNIRITGNFWDSFKLETAGKGGWFFNNVRVTGSNTLNSLFRVKGSGVTTVADNHVTNILSATTVTYTEAAVILDTLTDTFCFTGGTLGGIGKIIHCKDSDGGQDPRYIHIVNVRLEGNPGATDAVTIDAVDDFKFVDGYVGQSDNAFVVNAGRDIAIKNNHLIKMQRTALDLNGGTRVAFEGNTVLDCSQETDLTYSSVDVAANVSEWSVKGNTFRLRAGIANKPLRQLTIAAGTSNKFSYKDNDWGVAGTDFGAAGATAVSDASTGTNVVIDDSIPTARHRGGVAVSVTGTVVETTLKTVTIPAGALRTRDGIRVVIGGTTAGTNGTKTITFKFGASTVSAIVVPMADTDSWMIVADIFNANDVAAQVYVSQSSRTPAGAEGSVVRNQSGALAIATTADVIVSVTGTLANAGDTIVCRTFHMDVIRR